MTTARKAKFEGAVSVDPARCAFVKADGESFRDMGFLPRRWIEVRGFGPPENRGAFKLAAVEDNALVTSYMLLELAHMRHVTIRQPGTIGQG